MTLDGSRLLLVEDEPIIGFALEDMMMEEGAQTQFASSLEAAMKLVNKERFDGAIVDINLHGQESYELARELMRQKVPFIFATGYGEMALPAEFEQVPVISKPYSRDYILAAFAGMG